MGCSISKEAFFYSHCEKKPSDTIKNFPFLTFLILSGRENRIIMLFRIFCNKPNPLPPVPRNADSGGDGRYPPGNAV